MEPIAEDKLRDSFVNCTKGEAERMSLPVEFNQLPWGNLDYLGWRDPKAPQRAYMVLPWEGRVLGISLRGTVRTGRSMLKSTMCSLCKTVHTSSGVAVFSAPRAGETGREGNTVGAYMCSDLNCSLYVRGLLRPDAISAMDETLDASAKIERLRSGVSAFAARVIGAGALNGSR